MNDSKKQLLKRRNLNKIAARKQKLKVRSGQIVLSDSVKLHIYRPNIESYEIAKRLGMKLLDSLNRSTEENNGIYTFRPEDDILDAEYIDAD